MADYSGNAELDLKIAEWLKWDKNEQTLSAIKKLVDSKNFDQLSNLLLNRLTFGTAGLRGKMAAGYASMNDLVIIQTAQGLLKYLEKYEKDLLTKRGIVIGYDGRHNSKKFAQLTATVFLNANYSVMLFSEVVPTPLIPFSVGKYKCACGVMVTASHNPKEDNGYKVYGSNACQIIPPADKHIQEKILENLEPLETSWMTDVLDNSSVNVDPLEEVFSDYLSRTQKLILPEYKEINQKVDLLFTYTPMHGVGYSYIKKVFDSIGVRFVVVEEQKLPHADFPTVKYPNPEEGKSSLNLAFETANKNSSRVIIANDPDADRMAIAEKNPETNEWKILTGNEVGALLGWWCLHCFKLKNPETPLDNVYMISSTVSSMILKTMAKKEGFHFVETLTGFKWLGTKMLELLKEGKHVIFAFEEAIGFLCVDYVFDKDGISASAVATTLASFVYSKKQTLVDKLNEIYEIYGFHVSINSYFKCEIKEVIQTIFSRMRKEYPKGILNNKYEISGIRDLTTGYDSTQLGNMAILPISKSNHMLTFYFTNGLVCTIRTSGTEPKIKYYTEMCADPAEKNKEKIKKVTEEMVNGIIDEFIQPKINGLCKPE